MSVPVIRIRPAVSGLRFPGQKRVAKYLELPWIRLALCTAECIDRLTDTHIHEAAVLDHLLPGCARQTTGNSGRPKIDVGDRRRRHRSPIGDVGKLQIPARPKNAPYLGEHLLLV